MQLGGTVVYDRPLILNSGPYREPSGEINGRRDLHRMKLRERLYPGGLRLGTHTHRNAYLAVVLEGECTEICEGVATSCHPGMIRFLPAGESHSNTFESNVRCLLVELEAETLEDLRRRTTVLECPGEVSSARAALLARRLYSEFLQRDDAAPIAMEGLVLEILAESVRAAAADTLHAPKWLVRARDMIQARFLEVPSLTEIAVSVGVHPVHLSREFRRYFDCTVGGYMRKLRIDHASHLLASTSTPLSEIASVCGFADQSHFSSMFKRSVGVSPGRYREVQT